ncbi:RidA family protein [Curtobacterium sp. MCBA15_008]|uniref:RidA family protein n=1 Tax=Curtobacterium sp. MCBA15_008 TaxID=1898736 RepID=UPI0009F4165F|nr:RidA family protein [Curtobacterium sp. MCBA15_008]
MSAVSDRLVALGIVMPTQAAAPAGTYVPAVISGNYVYTAGQLPYVGGVLTATGKVGTEITVQDAAAYARVAAVNALAAVEAALGSLDRVRRIVKVVGFVASDPGFFGQPEVLDGASDLLGAVFGDAGTHARSAVGVAVLPLNAPVEVELVVEFS